MSWFGGIVETISGIFSFSSSSSNSRSENHNSSSTTQTIYDPDKVRVAELENQRAEMLVEAQKEIIELNARMQAAIIEANARGLEYSANVLKQLTHDMGIMAKQRLELLENGHLEVVHKIESMYTEFEREIKKDNKDFQLEFLPEMFKVLSDFPENSDDRKSYASSIDLQIQMNINSVADKLKGLAQRQQDLINSSIVCKEKTLDNSLQLDINGMQLLEKQMANKDDLLLNAPETLKSLPSANKT